MQTACPKAFPRLVDLPSLGVERILALECERLIAPRGPIPLENVTHRRCVDLTAELLAEVAPTAVIMPLFAGAHDALSMIETLEALGYLGRILVIAPPLPRPALVERELRSAGPGLRLMLVQP